jgi:hypothetical protein
LFHHDSGIAEQLASDFRSFTSANYVLYTDVVVSDLEITPANILSVTSPLSVTFTTSVFNRGNVNAQNLRVEFWLGDPDAGGTLLGQSRRVSALETRCSDVATFSFVWHPGELETGFYPIYVVATYQNVARELNPGNNSAAGFVRIGPRETHHDLFLPTVDK